MYKVEWKDEAKEDLKKIDRITAKKIIKKVESYLVKNPTELGKPLQMEISLWWLPNYLSN